MSIQKMVFVNLIELIAYISHQTTIYRTSLKRNQNYYKLLMNYWLSLPFECKFTKIENLDNDMLKAVSINLQLENSNLKNQVSLLNKSLSTKLSSNFEVAKSEDRLIQNENWYIAYTDTARVLKSVIDRINQLGEILIIDPNLGQIIDLSASPNNNVVAKGNILKPFITYLHKLDKQEQ
ncbi:hypothetical protein [Methylophilus sp.]|jgi:hypothetical protein|uniref:hypothetical protein n=1 Tax=Methylophilus sp. TaxID=29541 RepID=UPI0011D93077|nr:hypothetical protein [Methylophilus sp.]TXI45771.1 MAG: hypothetical protein E6Q52_05160 [Methylophilus sp.]